MAAVAQRGQVARPTERRAMRERMRRGRRARGIARAAPRRRGGRPGRDRVVAQAQPAVRSGGMWRSGRPPIGETVESSTPSRVWRVSPSTRVSSSRWRGWPTIAPSPLSTAISQVRRCFCLLDVARRAARPPAAGPMPKPDRSCRPKKRSSWRRDESGRTATAGADDAAATGGTPASLLVGQQHLGRLERANSASSCSSVATSLTRNARRPDRPGRAVSGLAARQRSSRVSRRSWSGPRR